LIFSWGFKRLKFYFASLWWFYFGKGFGRENFFHAIGMAKAQRNAIIQNGAWGDKFSHNCAPIHGIGNERIP